MAQIMRHKQVTKSFPFPGSSFGSFCPVAAHVFFGETQSLHIVIAHCTLHGHKVILHALCLDIRGHIVVVFGEELLRVLLIIIDHGDRGDVIDQFAIIGQTDVLSGFVKVAAVSVGMGQLQFALNRALCLLRGGISNRRLQDLQSAQRGRGETDEQGKESQHTSDIRSYRNASCP